MQTEVKSLNKEFEFDEEFKNELVKKQRKKQLNSSMVLACILVLVSYIASYTAFLLFSLLIRLVPALRTDIASEICDMAVYTAQLITPYFIYRYISGKRLGSILFPEELRSEKTEKITPSRIFGYWIIAFSLSQITAEFSTFFTGIISAILQFFSKNLALRPEAFDVPLPQSTQTFALNFIAVAILPAILEELVFRGVLLSEFLKYGKTFAICASALFFASVHGSIEQMMYSFVYGIILGIVSVKTGSVIPGMIMHFLNNAYSCAVDYLSVLWNTDTLWTIIAIINFTLIFIGLVSIICRLVRKKIGYTEKTDSQKAQEELSGKETFSAFASPLMLVYYCYVLFETFYTYISYNF